MRLAEDVHACLTQGFVVFLDVKRDKYFARPFDGDLPANDQHEREHCLAPALQAFFARHQHELAAAGLVVAAAQTQEGAPSPCPIANHILGEADQRAFGLIDPRSPAQRDHPTRPIAARDIAIFAMSCLHAHWLMKTATLESIVTRVRRRRDRLKSLTPRSPAAPTIPSDKVALFAYLRPFYPRPYLCLFEALALLEFLAAFGLSADWVFGVQASPFNAHCWVQARAVVLNENSEFARRFTPIMVV